MQPTETDDGLGSARADLSRLCLATREVKPVTEMIRYVVAPDGFIVPDLNRSLPGRGAWITATRTALEQGIHDKAFARAFSGRNSVGNDLLEMVDQMLERTALGALSLANKAGQVLAGLTRIEAALSAGKISVLLHASDAAREGVRKLDKAAAQAVAMGKPEPAKFSSLNGIQLDLALGRSNVVHAALLVHPASQGFLMRCLRLERWRNGGPAV